MLLTILDILGIHAMADPNNLSKPAHQLAPPHFSPTPSRSPSPNASSATLGKSLYSDDVTINSMKEESNENCSPGTSQTHSNLHNSVQKQDWLNRFALSSSALTSFSNASGSYSHPNQQPWRLVRAVIRDGHLKLYKAPSDLGIKAFDPDAPLIPPSQPSLASGGQNLGSIASSSAVSGPNSAHRRVSSGNSSLMPPIAPKSVGTGGSRLFFKGLEPHPDLEYNERGKIVGGTDEAICHAILFGPSETFAETSVLLLPLLTDIVAVIDLLTLYSTSVSHTGTNASTIPFSSANHNLSTAPAPSPQNTPNHTLGTQLVSRLKLVIETIQDNFPGMLLDNTIFSVFMRLVESVSYHDDSVATDLKMSVFMKQKSMTEMLSYATHQDQMMWTGIQPNLSEATSDKLHYILNKVENNSYSLNNINYNNTNNASSSSQHTVPKLPSAISPSLILDINVDTFAKQIYHFHLSFSKDWSPTSDIALLFNTKYNYHRHSPLVFDSINTHFLGNLLIDHIFNQAHRIDNNYRGKVLTYWITLGNALKNSGDMVGWLSIATVVCSLPVLRLKGIWCYVVTEIRDRVIREWAPVVFDLERKLMISDMSRKSTYHVLAPQGIGTMYPKERVVPFFGDLCVKFQEGSTYKQCESRLNSIKTAFEQWDSYLDQITQNDTFDPLPEPIPIIQRLLYALLNQHFDTSVLYPEAILKMSLELEPSVFGQYLKFHDVQKSPLVSGSYLPTIFTTVVPSFSLFSKSLLVASSAAMNSMPKRSLRPSSSRSGDNFRSNTMHSTSSSRTIVNSVSSSSIHGSSMSRSTNFPIEPLATTTGYSEIDSPSRQFIQHHTSNNALINSVRDILNLGAHLYPIMDDIVLKSFDDDHSLSRSSSLADASKIGPSARRVSVQLSDLGKTHDGNGPLERPVTVVVKAATLDRLIDILVLGVGEFNAFVDNNPKGPLKVDMDSHTLAFFATFRSFCSSGVLLDSLKKRFISAQSAAISIQENHNLANSNSQVSTEEIDKKPFPNWDPNCDVDPASINWKIVAQIQIGILEACHLWVSQFFADFANDLAIRDQFLDLLKTFELELQTWKESGVLASDEYTVYYDTIEALHKKIRKLFIKKSYRPVDIKRLVPTFPMGTKIENLPLNGSIHVLEQLINDVDYVATEYYNMIQLKDWMEVLEYLEVQSADINGFFHYRPPHPNNDEELTMQDIYSYLEGLSRENPDDRFLYTLPRPIRELFKLHNNIVNYFTLQISDNAIKKEERVSRMMSILKILGISQRRMKSVDLFNKSEGTKSDDNGSGLSSHIPSFLESAISAAVVRPESRAFANSWVQASKEIHKQFGGHFNGSIISLESIIPDIPAASLKNPIGEKALTPCVGWVLERMIEIVCYLPNMSIESPRMINFDKRRYIYNFIVSVLEMKQHIDGLESLYSSGMDVTDVFNFTKRVSYIINPVKGLYFLDRKIARDAAYKELKEFSKSASKTKAFMACIQSENEKLKRDSRQRESIDRVNRDIKKATNRSKPPSAASHPVSERKSGLARFGGFFKSSVRPISIAISGNFAPSTEKFVHPEDLPDLNAMGDVRFKQIATINLANTTIQPFKTSRDNSRTMFKISGEGIQESVFQATSNSAADDWIRTLTLAQKQAALLAVMSPTSTKVFGVPVRIVCERENRNIPYVVETLLDEIEERGLDEVGLYRIPGSLASVQALKGAFDAGGVVNMSDARWVDINTATGCFKLYLRELPEPLLTSELFADFVICGSMGNSEDGVKMMRRCVHRLPPPNYNLLKRLVEHLVLVTKHGDTNLMHAVNLAIVFSMSFLPNSSSTSSVSNDLGAMQTMLKTMILNDEQIFSAAHEDDAEGPLPSQLQSDIYVPENTNGLQPPQLQVESESEFSNDEDHSSVHIEQPQPQHSNVPPSNNFLSVNPGQSEQDELSPIPRRSTSRNINKRFSSLSLASDLAEAGISFDTESSPLSKSGSQKQQPPATILEDQSGSGNSDKEKRDSFTEVSAY